MDFSLLDAVAKCLILLARPEGALSNELFSVLGDWNAYLKHEKIDPRRPSL
jgi:hypothetical protein